MIETLSRAAFATLAGSALLKTVASRYGMRTPGSFARRFVAGETMEEAIAAAAELERQGLIVTLDHLGERVATQEAALAAARDYGAIIEAAAGAGISRNLSVKLTQLGLDIDRATCTDNLRRVLDVAAQADFFVRIDMEGSAYTQSTFDVFESLWGIGCRNIGVVIQAYLRRSPGDVARMNELGTRVRLVKGAYREPREVAFQEKEDVDRAFVELMRMLLTAGHSPAIATHDPAMIEATRGFATERGLARTAYEFQLLYGIRRDLQRALAADGHPVRVYVPFGTEWFPYFMRRLGERPANVGFVMKSLFKEQQD
ncbi:MAG: proline dehydrogenase family protein [Acidobacteria bacterium]|nr:proline dehydrogenase family protein [Acidobacteriota bacterium]